MSKLQIKPDQRVALLGKPGDVELDVPAATTVTTTAPADAASVEAVVAFVRNAADLLGPDAEAALAAARRDALAWVAYPKAGKLGTDLNRDRLAAALAERGVRPVRQISVDDTWSALRFRPAD